MLLMGEKSIRQKCVIQYIDMQKQIINTSNSIIKKIIVIQYLDANNLFGLPMSENDQQMVLNGLRYTIY